MNDGKISFWKFLLENTVEIPIVQRDYAQGRQGKETLREKLIADLRNALDTKSELKLDFVYGAMSAGVLYPLDGQQRLTTLWLLHWYVAYRAKKICEGNNKDVLKKFTYETRSSSRAFCEHLSKFDRPVATAGESVADWIQDQAWFCSSWKNDPTVQSMLRMISGDQKDGKDGLEGAFEGQDEQTWTGYWEALSGDSCPIVFYYLDLAGIHQTDELYIKMNARGEPLTSFENLKADLVDYIRTRTQGNDEAEPGVRSRWRSFVDVENEKAKRLEALWSDVFWHGRSQDHQIDEICFAFLNRYLLNARLVAGTCGSQRDVSDPVFDYLYGNGDDGRIAYQSFKYYREVLTINLFEKLFDTLVNVDEFLKNNKNPPSPSWSTTPTTVLLPLYDDEHRFVRDFDGKEIRRIKGISQPQRVVFYAVCKFFEAGWKDSDQDSLDDWMRVVWNLVENAGVNTIDAMRGCLRLIDKLSDHAHGIIQYLSGIEDGEIESKSAMEQLHEEVRKARKIISDANWRNVIVEAEGLSVLKGRIDVLFVKGDETTLEEFGQALNLLKNILEKSVGRPYFLQKVLLSRLKDKLPSAMLHLQDNDEQKKTLLTKTLKKCFKDVDSAEIVESAIPWVYDVCSTNLLDHSRKEGKCIGRSGLASVVLWGTPGGTWAANENVILGNNHSLLSITEGVCLRHPDLKVENTNFVSWPRSSNVEFSYAGHWFRWWGLPNVDDYDIYMLKDNWEQCPEDEYLMHSEGNTVVGDFRTYYGFNIEKSDTPESFKVKLDTLIRRAEAKSTTLQSISE